MQSNDVHILGVTQTANPKRPTLDFIAELASKTLEQWLENLSRDNVMYLAMLLYVELPKHFTLQKIKTATVVASVLGRNEHTVRRWIDDFVENDGEFSDTQQGRYARENTLMSNEELC